MANTEAPGAPGPFSRIWSWFFPQAAVVPPESTASAIPQHVVDRAFSESKFSKPVQIKKHKATKKLRNEQMRLTKEAEEAEKQRNEQKRLTEEAKDAKDAKDAEKVNTNPVCKGPLDLVSQIKNHPLNKLK